MMESYEEFTKILSIQIIIVMHIVIKYNIQYQFNLHLRVLNTI